MVLSMYVHIYVYIYIYIYITAVFIRIRLTDICNANFEISHTLFYKFLGISPIYFMFELVIFILSHFIFSIGTFID